MGVARMMFIKREVGPTNGYDSGFLGEPIFHDLCTYLMV